MFKTRLYNNKDDTQHYEGSDKIGDVVHGVLGFDINTFHSKLHRLYQNTL